MKFPSRQVTLAVVIAANLSACAVGPDYVRPNLTTEAAWVAPLPHAGNAAALANWWAQWNDPVLAKLIDLAQHKNTTIAQAAARIAQSRAQYQSITSVLFPSFTASANDTHSRGGQNVPVISAGNETQHTRNLGLDAAWELDVVGGGRRGREAARRRTDARESDWHDARVSIAAEVAMQVVNLRSCEVLLSGHEFDARSRAETARLITLKAKAGFEAPAHARLTQASAAEASARLIQQRADCDILVKVLAELTATGEDSLRAILNTRRGVMPSPKSFAIHSVPAEAISQRPDVAAAEHELAAAMADIGVAMADRFPRITLSGSIGFADNSGGQGRAWHYGPALSLPIFDAGRRAANVDVARARYDEKLAAYKGTTLRAVREVEESLVRLDSTARRETDTAQARNGYENYLRAAEARVKAGAGNLTELEEARRAVVLAQGASIGVMRERLIAWIGLYKAVGGGWRD